MSEKFFFLILKGLTSPVQFFNHKNNLDGDGVDLDDIVRQYPRMIFHLDPHADILQGADSEKTVVKIQRSIEAKLYCAEKAHVRCFMINDTLQAKAK